MQDTLNLIGQRIKEYRTLRGYSQQNLAEICNLSPSYISRLETGSCMASLQSLFDIAAALDTSLVSFFVDLDSDLNSYIETNPRIRILLYLLHTLNDNQLDYVTETIKLLISLCKNNNT